MTLEMALITHRILPGSWFRRQEFPRDVRFRVVDGLLEGMSGEVRSPVPFMCPAGNFFHSISSAADDWEVVYDS